MHRATEAVAGPVKNEKRVLLVEDENLFAYALKLALELDPDISASGFTGCVVVPSATDAMEMVRRYEFAVALIDMHLPDGDGLTLGKMIRAECSGIKLLAVTGAIDTGLAAAAIEAGFNGYITKDVPFSFLVASVLNVLNDEVVVRLDRKEAHPGGGRNFHASTQPQRNLTLRENEVLSLLVGGATTEEIARELGVAPNTARTHIQNVLTKLQVRSRLEAAALAVRHGVSSP